MNYFVTAIGTDSGKTLASAILAEALDADYWKPVQAGRPTDTEEISRLTNVTTHKEAYFLNQPASPHTAAENERIKIDLANISVPKTNKHLIIEGAGGLLVPLNNNETVIDLIPLFKAEVILISNLYLGSINHSLLSIEALKQRGLKLKGIIFNGESNPSSEKIILRKAGVPLLLHIKKEQDISRKTINKYSEKLKQRWYELGYS